VPPCNPEGIATFVQAIRRRYNFMVADTGARLTPLARQLLFNAQQRVIVLDPTMISLRNVESLRSLPGGSGQTPRPLLVLNKAGVPGGLAREFIEDKLGVALDAVIPDAPRVVGLHSGLGTLAARQRGPFRNGIASVAQALGIGAQAANARAEAQPSYASAL
jgi:pilus assembly protein CpaE